MQFFEVLGCGPSSGFARLGSLRVPAVAHVAPRRPGRLGQVGEGSVAGARVLGLGTQVMSVQSKTVCANSSLRAPKLASYFSVHQPLLFHALIPRPLQGCGHHVVFRTTPRASPSLEKMFGSADWFQTLFVIRPQNIMQTRDQQLLAFWFSESHD